MAEAERSKIEAAAAPPMRRSDELEDLLKRIASHIAEVDTDPGPIPGGQSESVLMRGDAPATDAFGWNASNGAPTPAPINAERRPVAPPAAPIPSRDRGKPAANFDGNRNAPTASPRRAQPALEPPALRSALRRESPAVGNAPAGLSTPRAPGGTPLTTPSTSESAAALRHALREEPLAGGAVDLTPAFGEDAMLPPLRSMLDMMAASPVGRMASPDREAAAMPEASARARLAPGEAGFAEAARRIETALETLASQEAVDRLGERFSQLESEMNEAKGELKRLDGMEAQLGVLGTRLTDEQILALFGPLVPTAEDLTRFAEEAAAKVADRMLAAPPKEIQVEESRKPDVDGAANHQVKALSELLATFMDDRRRTDAGIQDALETLQLAMQHVLDQLDATGVTQSRGATEIAPTAQGEHDAAYATPESRHMAPEHPSGDLNHFEPDGHGLQQMLSRPTGDQPSVDDSALALPAAEAPVPTQSEAAPEPMSAVAAVAGGPPYARRGAPATELPRQVRYEPFPPPLSPPEGHHRAMVAAARRATEKARAEAGAQSASRPGKPQKRGMLAGLLIGGETEKSVAGVRPGVLIVTSLAAFLLAGYWLMSSPKVGIPGAAGPASIERTEDPAGPAPADGRSTPDGESESKGLKSAPGGGAREAAPNRTNSEELVLPSPGDQQEARMDATPTRPAGPGMAVALTAQPMTIESVMQARERARMASLSQRTGVSASQPHSALPDVSPVVTASLPSGSVSAAPAPSAGRQLALPPATAGPLSLRLAAAQGDASAQLEIATRLAEAKGVKQDFAEAALWYERAAAQGEAVALYRLATLHERGLGVKPDRERARGLYRQAANLGNVKAMHNLAVMSVSPGAGTPDYAAAAALFAKSASHGQPDSQYNLGVLYESGLGLPKDHAAAYRWYALAARSGDPEAARRRDLLIARLPPETIQAMNAQIAAWQPVEANERANDARMAGEAWKQRTAETLR